MQLLTCLLWFLAAPVLAWPLEVVERDVEPRAEGLPRLVIYFQSAHDSSGRPISLLPLITEKGIALTHLIVCSFHINAGSQLVLNDWAPSDARFSTMWNETAILREAGVKVMGMVGGYAAGSFANSTLDGGSRAFETYYRQLHDTIVTFGLQGMDLDVEQAMSQAGIQRLVARLRADFGADFVITLAPVASALQPGGPNLSGFDYAQLEAAQGDAISFYNAQFYSGFGTLATPADFQRVVAAGWAPDKILLGELTSAANGAGYVPLDVVNQTVTSLRRTYGTLGGVMGWEYFNSQPGGTAKPWEWAQQMTAILRPGQVATLSVTADDAQRLNTAWRASVVKSAVAAADTEGNTQEITPNVDYAAMVNA